MNQDFTFQAYKHFLETAQEQDYQLCDLKKFFEKRIDGSKYILVRHDVDRKPNNSLEMAKLEHTLGVVSTYYFRIVNESYDPEVIRGITELGHEIGYHYEELSSTEGDYQKAIGLFEKNLELMRSYYPIKTITMHGSPLSKWDNRLMWKRYDYKKFGLIAEPYFDLNFDDIFYLTDASRTWNNEKIIIRDKVQTKYNIKIASMHEAANMLKEGQLPDKILLNVHPHNWAMTNSEYYSILVKQSMKNFIKRYALNPIRKRRTDN